MSWANGLKTAHTSRRRTDPLSSLPKDAMPEADASRLTTSVEKLPPC
jgi:hypothetical protein